ncbi:hypothetical protein [Cylindrospermopsis raciborskii]|nr:hypothetical protein [Cylindrospermopsis raciborskii]
MTKLVGFNRLELSGKGIDSRSPPTDSLQVMYPRTDFFPHGG